MPSPPRSGSEPEIVLDLSRLLSRVMHPTPTGVDRCEMAYARGLLAAVPERLQFAAVHPFGVYGRLPRAATLHFLDRTEARWAQQGRSPPWAMRRHAAATLAALAPRPPLRSRARGGRFYVQASPNNLVNPRLVQQLLRRERARFVCLVHDLIPLEFPEYARPEGATLHRRRIETIVGQASGILTNSHATMASLAPWIARSGRAPLTAVAHLGTDVTPGALRPAAPAGARPYFVCIGTIEPRKNHLLLLNLWRRMAETRGDEAVPRLVLIGRRGWENEQVIDMLERCPALRGCVEEHNGLSDEAAHALLAGARGLLLPAFAEGYGMPVSEALALGVPVACSDLPALREAGAMVPEYLDPLDGPGWSRAIDDLARDRSPLAAAQAQRRREWRPHRWREHIAILLDLLHKLDA